MSSLAASSDDFPRLADIHAAAERLEGLACRTPLVPAPAGGFRQGRLFVKAEGLQRTGSFKFRGAYNRIATLSEGARAGGIVAYSSGNHAQGVAAAARLLDVHAAIVMPEDAPRTKIDNTRGHGAEIVFYDRATGDRAAIAADLAAERGAALVPPFDDPAIIAGQGTIGLELVEQAAEAGIELDAVVVPCSGGGLTSGIAIALAALSPHTRVYTAEPKGFDDTARSLAAGTRLANSGAANGLCDALTVRTPGELTFRIMRDLDVTGLVVSDDEVLAAMAHAFRQFKLVLEPGGAAGLAAVLAGRLPPEHRMVAVIGSGANVDASTFIRALRESETGTA